MKKEAKAGEPPEDKHSRSPLGILAWIFGILIVYTLSIGPVASLTKKGYLKNDNKVVLTIYKPVNWAYNHSFLHKPLGIYFHFWEPELFDKNGEIFAIQY